MQTYSHLLISAALARPLKRFVANKRLPWPQTSALLWGSVLPDLPLILITVGCGLLDLRHGRFGTEAIFENSLMAQLFDDWFFHSPWVISAQNIFHSPLLLLIYGLVTYLLWTKKLKGMGWMFWLFCAAFLHTFIDILVHHNDGPLLLFPLNWTLRFNSPVSYWDPQYYGIPFAIFEHVLALTIVLGFIVRKRRS